MFIKIWVKQGIITAADMSLLQEGLIVCVYLPLLVAFLGRLAPSFHLLQQKNGS